MFGYLAGCSDHYQQPSRLQVALRPHSCTERNVYLNVKSIPLHSNVEAEEL